MLRTVTPPALVADRYEIIRPLGRGTFAHTLLARDLKLGRQVTLKVLKPRNNEVKAYDLFEREATVLRELKHPGVPRIHTTLRAPWDGADAAFLVMDYVEGASLAELISDRRHLEVDQVNRLFLELLDVLEYLHSRVPPVLHRDIKPANIIVRPDGSPVLVDFGAVRNVFRAPDDDGSTVVGTYGYMPYEQYMGQASPASDLYALGATFLHLLTGRPPPEFMSTAGRLEVPMKKVAADTGFRFETICEVPSFLGSATDPITKLAQRLSGEQGTTLVAFGTEAGLFKGAGIPTVVCGPGSITQAHQPDEYVTLEQLARCELFLQGLAHTRSLP